MRLASEVRERRVDISRRVQRITANATHPMAMFRVLRKFGVGAEVAVATKGGAAGCLLVVSGCEGGAWDSFWVTAGTDGVAAGCVGGRLAGEASAGGAAGCVAWAGAVVTGAAVSGLGAGACSAIIVGAEPPELSADANVGELVSEVGGGAAGASVAFFLPSKIIGGVVGGVAGVGPGGVCGVGGFGGAGEGVGGISTGHGPKFTVLVVKFPCLACSTVTKGLSAFLCSR